MNTPRPGFKGLAEHDQRDHDGSSLVEGMCGPGGEKARQGDGDGRVEPRRPGTERDQSVHVGCAPPERGPRAGEEPAAHIEQVREGQEPR